LQVYQVISRFTCLICAAKVELISKKLIAQNSTLNQLIQARFNTLDDYNNTESKDIQKKIQDQSNFDEVDKQFQDNDAQINK
jgi:hypothetical protein